MTGWLAAVLVGLAGLVVTGLWFGVARRRRTEAALGVQALADLKWREGVAVVLDALRRDGYAVDEDASVAGTETMLLKGGERILLDYKHGTSYCLGSASVSEFFATLRLRGANRGILATLGTLEPGTAAAAGSSIELIDGAHLWLKVREFVDERVLGAVQAQARASSRHGIWTGAGGSLAAAAVTFAATAYVGGDVGKEVTSGTPDPSAEATIQSMAPVASTRPAVDDAALRKLNATAAALAEVARLTPEQLAKRRADAARQVSQLPQVANAAWSAQRTLLLVLNRTDGRDEGLIAETCRILLQHEELRYTRIQLNPPTDSKLAVRWRLCD